MYDPRVSSKSPTWSTQARRTSRHVPDAQSRTTPAGPNGRDTRAGVRFPTWPGQAMSSVHSPGKPGTPGERDRVRILHVQKASGVSGSERHLLSLLPALDAAGAHVRMCVLTTADGDHFVEHLRVAGVDTVSLRAGRDVNPRLVPALWRVVRGYRPDIVHTHLVH